MANKPMTLRERALGYLSRREHTQIELERKLTPHCENRAELAVLLDEFTRCDWLSETRYAEMRVRARQDKLGSRRIVHELREKGVSEETIAAALPCLRENDLKTAQAVWAKKFGVIPKDAGQIAKQMRFLAGRGFDMETIRRVIQQKEDKD